MEVDNVHGDHVAVNAIGSTNWHHAVYVGRATNGLRMVVDFRGPDKSSAKIAERSYADFMKNASRSAVIHDNDTKEQRHAELRVFCIVVQDGKVRGN
ncbi:hypothetical protein HDV00_008599 [Rhizophlyctis rosea]|nr:hypothetical protein HDV00_008599 [Rhizophlyctis rosea]